MADLDLETYGKRQNSLRELRKILARDSEGYFERADTDGTNFLTFQKLATCFDKEVDVSGLELLFDEMDVNKDGHVTVLEFNSALASERTVLPPMARWIHSGDMNKKIAARGKSVQTRFTVLTPVNIYFSKHFDVSGEGRVLESDEETDKVILNSFRRFDRDGNGYDCASASLCAEKNTKLTSYMRWQDDRPE